jgi:hypothetical protein
MIRQIYIIFLIYYSGGLILRGITKEYLVSMYKIQFYLV